MLYRWGRLVSEFEKWGALWIMVDATASRNKWKDEKSNSKEKIDLRYTYSCENVCVDNVFTVKVFSGKMLTVTF